MLKKKKLEQTIPNRLQWIEEKGYPAALLWSAQATDLATLWTEREIQDTVAYINASRETPGSIVA